MSNYFAKRYIEIVPEQGVILVPAAKGHVRRRSLPLLVLDRGRHVQTVATLDDPGAQKRGWSMTTGMVGRNKDVASVFVTITAYGEMPVVLEIPRKYGVEARQAVAQINAFVAEWSR
jgi:hypothetical protein